MPNTHHSTSFQTSPPFSFSNKHKHTNTHKSPPVLLPCGPPCNGDSERNMVLVSLDTHCFQFHTQQGWALRLRVYSLLLQLLQVITPSQALDSRGLKLKLAAEGFISAQVCESRFFESLSKRWKLKTSLWGWSLLGVSVSSSTCASRNWSVLQLQTLDF